jgi:hypothetical protein
MYSEWSNPIEPGRYLCPLCGKQLVITKEGFVRKHKAKLDSEECCPISGSIPPDEWLSEEEARVARVRKMREEVRIRSRELAKARRSKEWKLARKELIGEECELCGSKGILCIHHYDETSYQDIENYKRVADKKVVTLCKDCHYAVHNQPYVREDLMRKLKRDGIEHLSPIR